MPKRQIPLSIVQDIMDRIERGETVRIRWGDTVRGYSGGTIDHLLQSPIEGGGVDRAMIIDLWGYAPTAIGTIVWFHLEQVEILEEKRDIEIGGSNG